MKQTIKMPKLANKKIVVKQKNENDYFNKETLKHLLKSEEDIENGRTRDAREVIKEMQEKYGF